MQTTGERPRGWKFPRGHIRELYSNELYVRFPDGRTEPVDDLVSRGTLRPPDGSKTFIISRQGGKHVEIIPEHAQSVFDIRREDFEGKPIPHPLSIKGLGERRNLRGVEEPPARAIQESRAAHPAGDLEVLQPEVIQPAERPHTGDGTNSPARDLEGPEERLLRVIVEGPDRREPSEPKPLREGEGQTDERLEPPTRPPLEMPRIPLKVVRPRGEREGEPPKPPEVKPRTGEGQTGERPEPPTMPLLETPRIPLEQVRPEEEREGEPPKPPEVRPRTL